MYIRRNGDLIFPKQNGYWVVKTKIVHFLFYCLVVYYSSYFYDSKVKRKPQRKVFSTAQIVLLKSSITLIRFYYTNASANTSANGVVGRPINAESTCESSNNPPFEAPVSESANISAKPSGKPKLFRIPAYSASVRLL